MKIHASLLAAELPDLAGLFAVYIVQLPVD